MNPRQRELARQRFIKWCLNRTSLNGIEAESVFYEHFWPLCVMVDSLLNSEGEGDLKRQAARKYLEVWIGERNE